MSGRRGEIRGNNIYNIYGDQAQGHVSYGIAVTRGSVGGNDLTANPRSQFVNVSSNIIRSVDWEGIDIRGGDQCSVVNNKVYACAGRAISIGSSGATEEFANLSCEVIGNTVDSHSTAGDTERGIRFYGSAAADATGSIIGNTIIGYGNEASHNGSGMIVAYTEGVVIANNTLKDCSSMGIRLAAGNHGFNVIGNIIISAWSDTDDVSYCRCISVGKVGNDATGYIGGNTFRVGSKVATYVSEYGIYIETGITGAEIRLGENFFDVGTLDIYDSDGVLSTLWGSAVWDPGNLVDGAGETKQLTVTGAALGDYVLVSAPYDLQDMVATAYVQAANTVEIRLQNESTGAIDLVSGDWKVKVIKD